MIGLPYMAERVFNTPNYALRKGQLEAARHAGKNVILVGECGSGKTEAAYFWLRKSQKRAIYIMPRRVLATQTQERLNAYDERVYGYPRWSVQHSSAREDEQFASSHVVTTIDQVSAKYLALGRFDAIGGSRVMQSDLIIDEVQLMEGNKTLQLLIQMLEQTTKLGNHFMLMTATIPDSFIKFFQEHFGCEVIRITETIHTQQENVLRLSQDYPMADINRYNKKQIIIANTQKEQAEILAHITDQSRVILLNSYLLPSERKEREADAYRYFGKNTPENNKILLSTQIIEAGMDISAGRMITSLAPIDSLVQRAGRLNRWGGNGDYIVVLNAFTRIYDDELMVLTVKVLKKLEGLHFDWEKHLDAVSDVMDGYYSELLKERNRRIYAMKLKRGGRAELIRDIKQVNVIVSDTFELEGFKREAVSLSIHQLTKANPAELYRLERGKVLRIALHEVRVGDTVLVTGEGFSYTALGLRVEPDQQAPVFPIGDVDANKGYYEDYVEESWLTHAKAVERAAYKRLLHDQFIKVDTFTEEKVRLYRNEANPTTHSSLYKTLAQIIGLHDLGKLTIHWQRYIGSTDIPLAHKPWEPRATGIIQDRKHNIISALALKDVLSPFSLNIILQHHGRLYLERGQIQVQECDWVKEAEEQLRAFGWTHSALTVVKSFSVREQHVITPDKPLWGLYLYLLGVCMEADINGIKNVKRSILSKR